MKKNIKITILLLVSIIIGISYLYNIVNAAYVTESDVKDGNYDFTLSYQSNMSSDLIHKTVTFKGETYKVFCREKGGTLYGGGHGVAKYYYRKTFESHREYTTKSSSEDTRKLAYCDILY